LHFPDDAGRKSLEALPRDLTRNLNLVYGATTAALTKKLGRQITDDEFEIHIEQVDDHVFAATTDISEQFGLGDKEADKVVQDALLAIAGLNQRLEEIEAYRAIIGFRDTELSLAQEKLTFLVNEISPDAQEGRFDRVISDWRSAGSRGCRGYSEHRAPPTGARQRRTSRVPPVAPNAGRGNRRRDRAAARERAGKDGRSRSQRGWARLSDSSQQPGSASSPSSGRSPAWHWVPPTNSCSRGFLPEPGPVSFIGSTYRSIFE